MGVDVGRARVGIAASDDTGALAMPVETVQRGNDTPKALERVHALADEYAAVEIVVGLPLSLSGADTASTQDARDFASLLARGTTPVRLVDERMSTVSSGRYAGIGAESETSAFRHRSGCRGCDLAARAGCGTRIGYPCR